MTAFLRWWLFFNLLMVSSFACYRFDIFNELYEKDFTKLSFIILGIFYFISIICGLRTYQSAKLEFHSRINYETYMVEHGLKQQEKVIYFCSELCMALGMAGTVFGFISIAAAIGSANIADIASNYDLLPSMGAGMATAFYTTLVGLLSAILLQIQHMNLVYSIDEK